MKLELLINAVKVFENNKLDYCSGWWHKKILSFNIECQDDNEKFLCHNFSLQNTEHLMWNNKRVCHQCIIIGNKLYALRYFYVGIINNLIEKNPLLLPNMVNFIRIVEKKLKDMSLNRLIVSKVYIKITNIYCCFFHDPIPIEKAIEKFENIYNPNYNKKKYLTNKNKQYLSMKKLLEYFI
jgi:hypothetical protein